MPDLAYGSFDETVLTEINIDVEGDLEEDLVVQAIPRGERMYFLGPVAPLKTGLESEVLVVSPLGSVEISGTSDIKTTTVNGVRHFARPL